MMYRTYIIHGICRRKIDNLTCDREAVKNSPLLICEKEKVDGTSKRK